ncbi:hypothetical protein C8Q76DRAFT_633302, partial [Earliella scabrosa]
MSSNTKALVHEVIPYIDLLTEHLDRIWADDILHPIVHAAAEQGHHILDKYYSKTDQSIILYHFDLFDQACMHPVYKLLYFHAHEWPAEWIVVARQLIENEWKTYYK